MFITDLQILEHPKSAICEDKTQVSLNVSAVGPGPLSYRWQRHGADIDEEVCTGVDEPTLTIPYFSLKDEGQYLCEVKSNDESVESDPSKLELSE